MSRLPIQHMRISRFGSLFLAAGAVVGAAAGIGLLFGFEPASLPPALLNIAAYKLTFIGAFGLLAAGAVMIRYGKREELRDSADSIDKQEPAQLREGQARPFGVDDSERASRESSRIKQSRQQ